VGGGGGGGGGGSGLMENGPRLDKIRQDEADVKSAEAT